MRRRSLHTIKGVAAILTNGFYRGSIHGRNEHENCKARIKLEDRNRKRTTEIGESAKGKLGKRARRIGLHQIHSFSEVLSRFSSRLLDSCRSIPSVRQSPCFPFDFPIRRVAREVRWCSAPTFPIVSLPRTTLANVSSENPARFRVCRADDPRLPL